MSTSCTMPKISRVQMPKDGKTFLGYAFWNLVNEIVVVTQFKQILVEGAENLPEDGAFLLIANHSRRWDGPIVQYILNRRANYMVSPNEMKGLQGAAVMSVGAFPANPRLNPVGYGLSRLRAGEPVVVFPEGNIFYDGEVHPFKTGVAKIATTAAHEGNPVPVIPMYIEYTGPRVRVSIGKAVSVSDHIACDDDKQKQALFALSRRMRDAVVGLRQPRPSEQSAAVATKTAACNA